MQSISFTQLTLIWQVAIWFHKLSCKLIFHWNTYPRASFSLAKQKKIVRDLYHLEDQTHVQLRPILNLKWPELVNLVYILKEIFPLLRLLFLTIFENVSFPRQIIYRMPSLLLVHFFNTFPLQLRIMAKIYLYLYK